MSERVVFPKEHFVRTPDQDFSDDGNRFTMYLFHDILPLSYHRADFGDGPELFISPRIDYLRDCEEIDNKADEAGIGFWDREQFNGIKLEEFDMKKLIDLCTKLEEIIKEVRGC